MVKAVLKWMGVGLLLSLSVCLVAAALVAIVLRTSLPWTEGTRTVSGLEGSAEILRDAYGIPHIFGASDESIYFALGYAHAQDRLWQMTFNRRLIQGRLSEILGEATLETDIYFRAMDLAGAAERSLAALPDDTIEAVRAYTRGVNAVLEDPDFQAPPEFLILRLTPEPWREADCIGILKLMGFSLSGNARSEFARANLRAILGAEKARELYDPTALPNFVSLAAEDLGLSDTPQDEAPLGASDRLRALDGGPAEQSNNWVLDGSRTLSGSPLLANDPHLRASIPGIWYLAHLGFADRPVIGVTIPGIPTVLLGRNDTAAWAFTNTGPDIQDLYVVTVNPDNADEYATETGFEAFETREEVITVKDAEAVTLTFKRTRHGPVLPKDYTSYARLGAEDQEVALAWTLLDDADASLATSVRLMRTTSYDEARELGKLFVGPMQNILYADVTGTIGYLSPGIVPVRAADHDTKGRAPTDGTFARNDWQGAIAYDDLPFVKNPESGVIITANNQIVPDSYPHTITADWIATERSRRIAERLAEIERHDTESFIGIQTDTVSVRARRLAPLLAGSQATSALAREARQRIAAWDGTMGGDMAEPLIYVTWIKNLERLVTADDFGADYPPARGLRENFLYTVLSGESAHWCDVVTSDTVETCPPLVAAALEDATASLAALYGPNMDYWRWDAAHAMIFPHQPFDAIPVLGSLFTRMVPMGGGADTVNPARFDVTTDGTRYDSSFSASYRAIYDFADLAASRFMITTGQSGHLLSKHYDDMLPLWRDGQTITIETSRSVLAENTSRLRLSGEGA